MLGMRYAIDAVFVDGAWRVVDVAEALAPWTPLRLARGAQATLELPAGAVRASATRIGDELEAEAVA